MIMAEQFETFGPEWKSEMKKFRKDELINMIAEIRKSQIVEGFERVTITVMPKQMLIDHPGLTALEAKSIIDSAVYAFENLKS